MMNELFGPANKSKGMIDKLLAKGECLTTTEVRAFSFGEASPFIKVYDSDEGYNLAIVILDRDKLRDYAIKKLVRQRNDLKQQYDAVNEEIAKLEGR